MKHRVFAAAVFGVAAFGSTAAYAQALDLFRAATPSDVEAAAAKTAPTGVAATRERVVALGDGALDSAAELTIGLFPDASATFAKTGAEPAAGGGVIWTGSTAAGDDATLVFARGKVLGHVSLKGRNFEIAGAGGRAHRVVEVDFSKLPSEGPLTPVSVPAAQKKASVEPQAKGDTEIKTLIAYTDRVAAASSDIAAEADLAISLANQGYKASGVKIKMKLAGLVRVSGYDETTTSWEITLQNLAGLTGAPNPAPFSGVRSTRDAKKADLVALLRAEPQPMYCGLGYYIENPTSATSAYGYSETDRQCITNQSVTHEMGHNMGLNHDRYVVQNPSPTAYNFGYVLLNKQVRDIMGYNNQCVDSGFNCERLNRFSNPDQKVKKKPFGIPAGKPNPADNARRLNETRAGIASYR